MLYDQFHYGLLIVFLTEKTEIKIFGSADEFCHSPECAAPQASSVVRFDIESSGHPLRPEYIDECLRIRLSYDFEDLFQFRR